MKLKMTTILHVYVYVYITPTSEIHVYTRLYMEYNLHLDKCK